jgi:hypothetical protein
VTLPKLREGQRPDPPESPESGDDAARVLPAAILLVELRARVPRHPKEMLQWLARRNHTSVDDVLTRELEDMACAYAGEIVSELPGFELAMSWPECGSDGAE